MIEEWKNIKKHLYISNLGNIKSIYKNGKERVLKTQLHNGYVRCGHMPIHRLVAVAFVPNPNNLPQINHKDENKQNNRFDNLEWCTNKYNCNYGNHPNNMSIARKNKPSNSKGKHWTCKKKEGDI